MGEDEPRPGSKVVTDYLDRLPGLIADLEQLRFNVVGYGCTTCIGNTGPLPDAVSKEIADDGLVVSAVLIGQPQLRGPRPPRGAGQLPRLAAAGRRLRPGRAEWTSTGTPSRSAPARDGQPVFLTDIWPTHEEVAAVIDKSIKEESFKRIYGEVYEGDANWKALQVPTGDLYAWDAELHLHRQPAVLRGHERRRRRRSARSPGAGAGAARRQHHDRPHLARPATSRRTRRPGKYLLEHGVEPQDFNQYGARRGNHEVMMRGTFANVRLKNLLVRRDGRERAASRATCRTAPADEHLRRRDGVPEGRRAADRHRPARNTARARRATGPRRGRTCSA